MRSDFSLNDNNESVLPRWDDGMGKRLLASALELLHLIEREKISLSI